MQGRKGGVKIGTNRDKAGVYRGGRYELRYKAGVCRGGIGANQVCTELVRKEGRKERKGRKEKEEEKKKGRKERMKGRKLICHI